MSEDPSSRPDPNRFEVSKGTLWLDRAMNQIIRIGGVAVILAVFGIFFFIVKEVIPLFSGADVIAETPVKAVPGMPLEMGVDEWGTCPFLYDGGSEVVFISMADGSRTRVPIPGLDGAAVTATAYDPIHRRVVLGLADGRVTSFLAIYQTSFDEAGVRTIKPTVEAEPIYNLTLGSGAVRSISYGDGGGQRLLVAARDAGIGVLRLGQKRSLLGVGKLTVLGETDLSETIDTPVVAVSASQNGSDLLVATADGKVRYFKSDGGEPELRQTFAPFGGKPVRRMDYLFGGVSVAMTDDSGTQRVFSLFRQEGASERHFGQTKSFDPIGEGVPVFSPGLRNKSFLVGAGKTLSLRYLTSGGIRWQGDVDFVPVAAAIDAKSEHFFIAGPDGRIQRFKLDDRHPEAGWKAFFGKVWYEGGSKPVHQWQSTGGSDDFEPKLSLIPLIIGSLKGTFYALVFSIPIALLAAIFSAAFLPPAMKRVVKPAMEIMASLPSVVLGFLAGIWLAPILQDKVPSVILVILALPSTALLFGWLWSSQPIQIRSRLEGSREWIALIPLLLLAAWGAWELGPVFERLAFVYHDPASGRKIADFRLWWPQVTGLSYDQRNCLIVGFAMGFAVIPVIFTIAEDALSNVPRTLAAAASALGASRWQVVWTIILPVASPGIFSALMIGFGRAVGETMIMVMATGNTPVTEWNIFSGMRTLSANIAVELPEAAPGSTHYRTLFLGALVLFAFTFFLNSAAEIVRQRLRDKNRIA